MFYECIEFLDAARSAGGKVLVHCVQGVSRSVSVVIAYLIFKEKMNYDEAYEFVKSHRGIASPNIGFVIQLMLFHKRLYEDVGSFPIQPRVYAVGRHQISDPNKKLVCRLVLYFLQSN